MVYNVYSGNLSPLSLRILSLHVVQMQSSQSLRHSKNGQVMQSLFLQMDKNMYPSTHVR